MSTSPGTSVASARSSSASPGSVGGGAPSPTASMTPPRWRTHPARACGRAATDASREQDGHQAASPARTQAERPAPTQPAIDPRAASAKRGAAASEQRRAVADSSRARSPPRRGRGRPRARRARCRRRAGRRRASPRAPRRPRRAPRSPGRRRPRRGGGSPRRRASRARRSGGRSPPPRRSSRGTRARRTARRGRAGTPGGARARRRGRARRGAPAPSTTSAPAIPVPTARKSTSVSPCAAPSATSASPAARTSWRSTTGSPSRPARRAPSGTYAPAEVRREAGDPVALLDDAGDHDPGGDDAPPRGVRHRDELGEARLDPLDDGVGTPLGARGRRRDRVERAVGEDERALHRRAADVERDDDGCRLPVRVHDRHRLAAAGEDDRAVEAAGAVRVEPPRPASATASRSARTRSASGSSSGSTQVAPVASTSAASPGGASPKHHTQTPGSAIEIGPWRYSMALCASDQTWAVRAA